MELEFRSRNNDMGHIFPTFQERVNTMLPANSTDYPSLPERTQSATLLASSAAPVIANTSPGSPHMLNSEEMQLALAQVEQEAEAHNQELIRAHSGLTEQRVARLLGLLK